MIKHINRIGLGLLIYAAAVYFHSAAKRNEPPAPTVQPFDPTAFRAVDWFPRHGPTDEEKRVTASAAWKHLHPSAKSPSASKTASAGLR